MKIPKDRGGQVRGQAVPIRTHRLLLAGWSARPDRLPGPETIPDALSDRTNGPIFLKYLKIAHLFQFESTTNRRSPSCSTTTSSHLLA